MTVGDFLDFVEGYKLRTKENFMLSDHANFILGQYVMSAVGSMLSSKVKGLIYNGSYCFEYAYLR